jgi:hypothetical protein
MRPPQLTEFESSFDCCSTWREFRVIAARPQSQSLGLKPCISVRSPPTGWRWWRISPAFFARRIGLMFQEISQFRLAQADGGLPTMIAAGSAPGESGVFVFRARFDGGLHVSAIPRLHYVGLSLTPCAHLDCRIAGEALSHKPSRGSLTICPAGADYAVVKEARKRSLWQSIRASLRSQRPRARHLKQS